MQRALGAGLAFAIAAHAEAVCADPSAPQISPTHASREDAQRLEDELRGLAGDNPPAAAAPAAAPIPEAPAASAVNRSHNMRVAGALLLGVSAISALISVPLFEARSTDTGTMRSDDETAATVFVVTAVVAGISGAGLLWWSTRTTVQVAPTATSKSVGLAIVGRI